MKKLLLISVLLGSIILAGCNQKWLSESELFEKKQECNKLITNAEKWEEKFFFESENGDKQYSTINSIFYSPVLNTCLYEWSNSTRYYNEKWIHEHDLILYITDSLTYKTIFSIRFWPLWYPHSEYSEHSILFKEKIKELKWE